MTTELAILAKDLGFSYDNQPILQQVNLEIKRGEFIGVIGPNGGGKTTFLKLLMGFLAPTQGRIEIFGLPPKRARLKIGYVPQINRVDRDFPITLWDLVLLGALSKTPSVGPVPKEIEEKARELFDEFGLTAYRNKPFSSLSGGLAQRALLTRALLTDYELLLLDEPTANVDAQSAQQIFKTLDRLKGQKTILHVTHDLRTILERVDRILCVQGQIQSLLPKEICEHFALGLYHTPLLELPKNHFDPRMQCHDCSSL